MKKRIITILLASMLVLQLSGCGESKDAEGTRGTENVENTVNASSELSVEPGGILDPSAVLSLAGKDNSMDAYTAAMKVPLRVETPENAKGWGRDKVFLGSSKAYRFIKYFFPSVTDDWDELSFVTTEGETGSERFDWDHSIQNIGQAANTDHYITLDFEKLENGEDYRIFFTEKDENHEKLREIPLNFLDENNPDDAIERLPDFMLDASGTAHLLWSSKEGLQYLLISQEGEVLAKCTVKSNLSNKLIPLYDSRIALLSFGNGGNEGMTLQYMNAETNSLTALATWKTTETNPYYATLFDAETLLYADQDGVYRSGLSGENPELLYHWYNHGIIAQGVSAMQADEEEGIRIIYEDSEDYNYLRLVPTTEEVEICEITLAAPYIRMTEYQWAALEFNKRYPSCHIELTSYEYNDTALLTQLTVGKGPVLIDPSLMNFEELEGLWEPLDTVMEELGILDKLLPSVMEIGRINGKLYGMVTNFYLSTLVVNDPKLKDWDYDVFVQCIEDRPELESIFDITYSANYGIPIIRGYLCNGPQDNYFIDEETGLMHFDSDKFRKALEIANKYCDQNELIPPVSSLLEGKVLVNSLSVSRPEDLALYRICYGEDANYIGYPTKDGGTHFMHAGGMLSIRKTATKEEKEAAAAFISLCLSYEGQTQAMIDGWNFDLSVRKDMLEEQITSMNGGTRVERRYFDSITLGSDLNIELDRQTLMDMIDQAKPANSFPTELREIIDEELDAYFSGDITEEMLINHLESRVGLYQGERN